MHKFLLSICLLLFAVSVFADVYMHNMRGSNNRLNEPTATRAQNNRLFDSQNNARGGYNVGDKSKNAAGTNVGTASNPSSPDVTYDTTSRESAIQYQMGYFEGSKLTLEWTNQHGCGGNEADDPQHGNCQMVLQYMCETSSETDEAMKVVLRDGVVTTPPDENAANNDQRGHHESEAYYKECTQRNRNKGLFIADQSLQGNAARFTRQNANGGRSGLECPEERDYYPYWVPAPWRDIAVLTDHPEMCDYYKQFSQNVHTTYKCVGTDAQVQQNTEATCLAAGGTWKGFSHGISAPDCTAAPWTRDNHLGNSRNGQMANYNWTLPSWDELVQKGIKTFGAGNDFAKCVLRLRYNISTDDYDFWSLNATYNGASASPVTNNPTVDIGAGYQGLKLAVNTAQFGRTFQDRSHVFYIRKRPAALAGKTIYNLNVRGKRGNIVQTYPGNEYDFVPNRLHVSKGDFVHLQWTGSNTHNNGGNGGDGQTGDAGEGTTGTDRHNLVQFQRLEDNYPMPLDQFTDNIWTNSKCYEFHGTSLGSSTDCAVRAATSSYHLSAAEVDGTSDVLLNNAPASLIGGIVMEMTNTGTFHYMCTRNNNFSNRSQKGTLIVQ